MQEQPWLDDPEEIEAKTLSPASYYDNYSSRGRSGSHLIIGARGFVGAENS